MKQKSAIGFCRKKPKTLSGIETIQNTLPRLLIQKAGKNLKPYQGLKHPQVFREELVRAGDRTPEKT
ncbi:hypothetical protein E5S67_05964 [Microcoleus sp. IPMA8]|uniref:Uncharacterized protein n=1 Tax=Microcoleus asticus IPMA8 TaxID=2563858 RepID=A0ABX2D6B0_9CYAN|nr:hypothetical protein [Microcoleus asticus IPMA8]